MTEEGAIRTIALCIYLEGRIQYQLLIMQRY